MLLQTGTVQIMFDNRGLLPEKAEVACVSITFEPWGQIVKTAGSYR